MILVADSGSTKTTWMLVETGDKVVTEGLNPHFASDERFLAACAIVRQQFSLLDSRFSIHFYGAGCGVAAQRQRVAALLVKAFGDGDVQVYTDMLGACRALCADQPGLVGILGTGSNACLYDGHDIARQATSTGYILGDEGSANHVGRLLLADYLTHRMPLALRHMFHDAYPLSNAQLMDAVYHQPNPNRFLASLAPFAVAHLNDDYCHQVICDTLTAWWANVLQPLCRKRKMPLAVVGGFAKAIEPTLRETMHAYGLHVGTVLADPIHGLRSYHI